jgi:hypothetical protein
MSRLAAPSAHATPQRASQSCASCAHFCSDPGTLESRIPGLRSFGSGFAAVRSDDGLCAARGRYLSSSSYCAWFAARTA